MKFPAGTRVRCVESSTIIGVDFGQEYSVREISPDEFKYEGHCYLAGVRYAAQESRFEAVELSKEVKMKEMKVPVPFKIGDWVRLTDDTESDRAWWGENTSRLLPKGGVFYVVDMDSNRLSFAGIQPSPDGDGGWMAHCFEQVDMNLSQVGSGDAPRCSVAYWEEGWEPLSSGVKQCECGKESHGFASHSDWCDLHPSKD